MTVVKNKDRKFGSALKYIHIRHQGRDFLLTENEWDIARQRALQNKEDIPARKRWWQRLFGL